MLADNYIITEKTIKDPPTSFRQKLKFLGPGFILSASIVGSGELIATTILGAKAGFIAFWIIIVSCLVKVAVQLEFGKRAILTGMTPMQSFNSLSGPRYGKTNWVVWIVSVIAVLKAIQVGGMVGGSAVALSMLFPGIHLYIWVLVVVFLAAMLISRNVYKLVEKISLGMIAVFTITTITAVVALRYTEFSFTWADIQEGLKFKMPAKIVAVAFGAFGITGVGADEIIAYNYWCLEKGYAAYTGPYKDSVDWKRRARGWINVMYLDATLAMIIYTLVTAAFFMLGASILHASTIIPEGNGVIETLALIYTQSLGSGARLIYLIGAFFVLFSSVFASLAAYTRLYSDIAGQLGWTNFFDPVKRKKLVGWLAWIIPSVWAILYFFIRLPVLMIISGGIIGSVLLFIVVYAAIQFRKRRTAVMPSGIIYTTAFFISVISIIAVAVYGLVQLFS
ncbi:MAG: Nramp family divalent metal transporter [Bacteroidia bacterium]|nr:Nramp family divalent metal transporter [Bacteroidia bacterium]